MKRLIPRFLITFLHLLQTAPCKKYIGYQKCQGLLGFHHFSGADWGRKFIGITKKTWANAYLKLDDSGPVIQCFKELGESSIQSEIINDELPIKVKVLEHFICSVYSLTGSTTLPSLRWELFRSKNVEGEMLPSTRAALLPHIIRANYVSIRNKSYLTDCPELLPIEENGWNLLESGCYIPVKYIFFLFVHTIDYTQYITQIVQIQTQHALGHDRRDNKLIFCLLLHSHNIVLYVLKQQMLLDGIVFWSMVQSEGLETTNKI